MIQVRSFPVLDMPEAGAGWHRLLIEVFVSRRFDGLGFAGVPGFAVA